MTSSKSKTLVHFTVISQNLITYFSRGQAFGKVTFLAECERNPVTLDDVIATLFFLNYISLT